MLRVVCHYLLDRMPDESIPELCESFGRIYDFYSTRPTNVPSLPLRQSIRARRGQVQERPEFVIDEE